MADDAERVREADNSQNIARAPSLVPTDADVPTDAPADAHNVSTSRPGQGIKTPESVSVELMALVEQGMSVREAAIKVGIHPRTAWRLVSRYNADLDALQEATRKIMALEALDRVDDWRLAARVGASKRGNHLPAKDWLLHSGMIEPLQGEHSGGIRIAINIGTDDRPMRIPSPLRENDEE